MSNLEIYSDSDGNLIEIEQVEDGVYVSAKIKTKPQYTGGANATAARAYTQKNGLKRKK